MTATGLRVLLVEDDHADVVITREALVAGHVQAEVTVASSGREALAVLRSAQEAGRLPHLVLLDLNLPGMTGHDVLAAVKGDPELRRVPVVVLSTSSSPADVRRCYELHANVYITKPLDFEEFASVVRQVDVFFGTVARLPDD